MNLLPPEQGRYPTRREVLSRLLAAIALLATAATAIWVTPPRREFDLTEADLYRPHDLAG